MNNRAIVTLVLAVLLILIVMSVTAALTFSGNFNAAKWTEKQIWSQSFPGMLSMNIIDLTGDQQKDLFMQNDNTVTVLDASGKPIFTRKFTGSIVTTMGDVNGDNVEDIVIATSEPKVYVLNSKGESLWTIDLKNAAKPMRAAVVRFKDGAQVIIGDERGAVIAFNNQGQELWRAATTVADYIRGLDDVSVGGNVFLAAANHNGMTILLDAKGKTQWTYNAGTLRRLRAYDLGGGNGSLLLGNEAGVLTILDAATGKSSVSKRLGQTIIEIRDAEIDGNPSTREFVVGGKDGGVWAFRGANAEQLWSGNASERVNEIAAIDIDDDGKDEVIIGNDAGGVKLFDASGGSHSLLSRPSGITRIDAGKLTDSEQIVVADGSTVQLLSLKKEPAPIWYNPLIAGLLISLVIVIAAWFIATAPPKPALRLSAEDSSVESLQAQKRMLHESIADVERLKQSGEIAGEAYLLRLKELRAQLAENEAALQQAGVKLKPETFKCPNCAGTLMLGMDKCEYCGQVVIS